jgi:hypothetical protein
VVTPKGSWLRKGRTDQINKHDEDLADWGPVHHLPFSADIILCELTPAFQTGAAAERHGLILGKRQGSSEMRSEFYLASRRFRSQEGESDECALLE